MTDLLGGSVPEAPPVLPGLAAETSTMFERLARDPAVSVEKLQALLDMHERVLEMQARAAFDTAFVRMLPEIPTIEEHSKTDKTTYAPLEDIIEVVKPILSKHGFAISFKTDWGPDRLIIITGILSHIGGHVRMSHFQSQPDKTGSKNDIQAQASTISYGKRYVTKDLLAIVTREEDDDGERAGKEKVPDMPQGYPDWVIDLGAVADEGTPALERYWADVHKDPKQKAKALYLTQIEKQKWERIKVRAAEVTKKAQSQK